MVNEIMNPDEEDKEDDNFMSPDGHSETESPPKEVDLCTDVIKEE